MAHGYALTKARVAMTKAAGDPANAGPLTAWIERQLARTDRTDEPHGVIVAEDGTIVGETWYWQDATKTQGAVYLDAEDARRHGIRPLEVGMALGALKRSVGQTCVHFPASQLLGGSGEVLRADAARYGTA